MVAVVIGYDQLGPSRNNNNNTNIVTIIDSLFYCYCIVKCSILQMKVHDSTGLSDWKQTVMSAGSCLLFKYVVYDRQCWGEMIKSASRSS